ncbi:hypothetical protein [Mycoplasma sp. 1018B]|uniref:hypothetical protein n=1 Tax=Mycoplasma sp. 1018B TaxID=2967302 RepID=UPI00211C8B5B|nr:hypothetical protein [Mycoplasma sp. 1018B]UUM19088.1 hypothetical protein NPA14_01970 [Mycoplasma sp. 1018B]
MYFIFSNDLYQINKQIQIIQKEENINTKKRYYYENINSLIEIIKNLNQEILFSSKELIIINNCNLLTSNKFNKEEIFIINQFINSIKNNNNILIFVNQIKKMMC